MKVLVTGSSGFIGRYILAELARRGHEAVTFDLADGQDARDREAVFTALTGCDHFIAAAALCGGVRYMNAVPHDILAQNLLISAASSDAAIEAHQRGVLQKITVVSSSMAYEMAGHAPLMEYDVRDIPAPQTAYGFSKLAGEYLARAASEQHGLPYTIVRLFNCTGPGDRDHVITDLVRKVTRGDNPLHILGTGSQVRCFTWAEDIAEGVVTAMEHPAALNNSFNIASQEATTIFILARKIWQKIRDDEPRIQCDASFPLDVQRRIPSVEKARSLLNFEAKTSLDVMLDKVIQEAHAST